MTGAEHYAEAERDLRIANGASINDGSAAYFLARAQVHATLALVAATEEAAGPMCGHGYRGFCASCVLPPFVDACANLGAVRR